MPTLSKSELLRQLKNNPGIDKNVLSAYEKGGKNLTKAEADAVNSRLTGKTPKVQATIKQKKTKEEKRQDISTKKSSIKTPQERASGLQMFSSALQDAINLARTKRQSKELDFLQGVIPKGAVTAGQFTSLLSNLNQASARFAEPLASEAVDIAKTEQAESIRQQGEIRDLALSVAQNGGTSDVVNGILNATDIDSAIGMAAGVLNTKEKKLVTEKMDGQLVQYDPADPEGTAKVIWSSSTTKGGGKSPSTTTSTDGIDPNGGFNFIKKTMADVKVQMRKMFAPEIADQIMFDLTDEELRMFLDEYSTQVASQQMSLDPLKFYQQWKVSRGLEEGNIDTSGSQPTNRFRKSGDELDD